MAKILAVDDDPLNLAVIEIALEDSPHDLTLVKSGEAAWLLLNQAKPPYDLIVLDKMMPGLDGLGLTQRIRNSPRLRRTWILLVSAAASEQDRLEGLLAGVDEYLIKPFSPDDLVEWVERLLAGNGSN